MVQIAGLVARRIVKFVNEGERLAAGQRFGLIRFGSRVDVYLPKGAECPGLRRPACHRRRNRPCRPRLARRPSAAARRADARPTELDHAALPGQSRPLRRSRCAICCPISSRFWRCAAASRPSGLRVEGRYELAVAPSCLPSCWMRWMAGSPAFSRAPRASGPNWTRLADFVNFGVAPAIADLHLVAQRACARRAG